VTGSRGALRQGPDGRYIALLRNRPDVTAGNRIHNEYRNQVVHTSLRQTGRH
jgi:hypothetical protein